MVTSTSVNERAIGGTAVTAVFERLYSEYFTKIRNFLHSRCQDWHLAEDLTQEVFAKLWEQLADGYELDPDVSEFSILARRAQNALYQHRRLSSTRRELLARTRYDSREQGRKVEVELPASAGVSAPAAVEDVAIGRFQIGAALAMLTPVQRRAVALRYLEDLPPHEVAAQTGSAERTVKQYTHDALGTLRTAFGVPLAAPIDVVAERRELARETYRASVAAGAPMTLTMLARQFGRSATWARLVIHESGDYQPRQADRDRVLDALRQELADGKYTAGERMPTCEMLAGRFGVCSGTASWALRQLATEGLAERRESIRKNDIGFYALPLPAAAALLGVA